MTFSASFQSMIITTIQFSAPGYVASGAQFFLLAYLYALWFGVVGQITLSLLP